MLGYVFADKLEYVKLPNGERADVPVEKLTEYVLNPDHPRGGHKSIVFQSALGITRERADFLRDRLIEAAAQSEASSRGHNGYGESYTIIFSVVGLNGNLDFIKSGWQIDDGTDVPRLVSCYVDR